MSAPDDETNDDELALMLVEFETRLAAGNHPTTLPEDRLSGASEAGRQRLEEAQECVVLFEEIWPHSRPLDGQRPKTIGRFRIERELGRGGFGIVYLAHDERLAREVALKVQRPEAIISATLRGRFLREAKAAARLRHPHIAGVYDVGEDGLQIWIASEYVAGDSLAAWLRNNPAAVAPRDAAVFMASLADAVEFAHRNGVLHRDLKPGNVLLHAMRRDEASGAELGEFHPKLIDFGLAKLEETQRLDTHSGALVGTPPYMAPEQATGNVRQIGPATDVYGLGTILYELLTGRGAFGGENDVQTLRQVTDEEPIRPRKLRPRLPADLEAICLKCLEKQPHKRYPTAGALAADLERFLAGRPTQARPAALPERWLKWARSHRTLSALMGVSVAAAIAIVAITAVYIVRLNAANRAAEISAENSLRQELVANQYLYSSRIRLANQSFDQGDVEQAKQLLDYYRPASPLAGLRGFEWYQLKRRLHSERLTLVGHKGEVYAVTFSPDGWQVVSGGQDGTIRVWDAESGRELKAIAAHKSCVNAVVYSPDGKILASASCDHTIKLWDPVTLELVATLEGHLNEVHCLAFCPTAPHCLAAGGHEPVVRIWDWTTREVVRTIDAGSSVDALAWQPDGKTLFRAGGTPTDESNGQFSEMEEERVASYPSSYTVATSSRGDVCWGLDNAIRHVDPAPDSQPLELSGHIGHIEALAFSPRGDRFASASGDRTIRVWDRAKNTCSQVFTGHTARVQALAFSPRGGVLASAGHDGMIKLWNDEPTDRTVFTSELCVPIDPRQFRHGVAISSDFRYLALLSDVDEVRVHRLSDGTLRGALKVESFPLTLQFLPGKPVLLGTNLEDHRGACEWDVEKWQAVKIHPLPTEPSLSAAIFGRFLVTEHDRTTRFTDTITGAVSQQITRQRGVDPWTRPSQFAFSPDRATLLVARGADEPDWMFEAPHGSPPRAVQATGPPLAISPGGELTASLSHPHAIALSHSRSGRPLATLRHPQPVGDFAFSPDGKTLAAACGDRTVFLWNVASGQEVTRLTIRPGNPFKVEFSADGRQLVAVSRTDLKHQNRVHTYPDGTQTTAREDSTAVITIWNGIEDE